MYACRYTVHVAMWLPSEDCEADINFELDVDAEGNETQRMKVECRSTMKLDFQIIILGCLCTAIVP